MLHKRRLGSKCSLSRRPESVLEPLHPVRRGSFPPAIAASSAPARLPELNGWQTRAAVQRPLPAADLPRWCTQSAAPVPPWQTAPSEPARHRAVPRFFPVLQETAQSSWRETSDALWLPYGGWGWPPAVVRAGPGSPRRFPPALAPRKRPASAAP